MSDYNGQILTPRKERNNPQNLNTMSFKVVFKIWKVRVAFEIAI